MNVLPKEIPFDKEITNYLSFDSRLEKEWNEQKHLYLLIFQSPLSIDRDTAIKLLRFKNWFFTINYPKADPVVEIFMIIYEQLRNYWKFYESTSDIDIESRIKTDLQQEFIKKMRS
jgi:hypothetical protein